MTMREKRSIGSGEEHTIETIEKEKASSIEEREFEKYQ